MNQGEKSICDSQVFEEVYKTNITTLRNYIYYKSGDINIAEDIAQDCFLKIWNNCATIIYSTVKSLLYKMAKNSFLNIVTKNKLILEHQKLSNQETQTSETPEFVLQEKEFLKKLQATIAALPDKEKEVFLLNRIDKKKYREIAELLNISVKTVEKRMSSALKKIRKKIDGI